MKKIINLFILLIIFLTDSYSQSISPEWAVRLISSESSYDYPRSMAVDSAGNVFITGNTNTDEFIGYLTVKYNSSGVLLWEARYNTNGYQSFQYIAVDKSGNVFVTGSSHGDSSDYDFATIKYNSDGVQQWVDRYNGSLNSTDYANSITIDISGNIYVCGQSKKDLDLIRYQMVIIKYDSSGNRIWVKSYNYLPNSSEYCVESKSDNSGNLYVGVISTIYPQETRNAQTIKYDSSGNQLWLKFYPYPNVSRLSLNLDGLGNIFLAVRSDQTRIIKYNSSGIQQWITQLINSESFYKSVVDSIGNSYLLLSSFDAQIITYKYNSFGIFQWMQNYNSVSNTRPNTMSLDLSGNVYVSGSTYFPSTLNDYTTIKYSSSGIRQWVSRYSPSNYDDVPEAIGIDYSGNVYITGTSIGLYTEIDYFTLKYSSSLQLNANILLEGFYNEGSNILRKKDTITAYIRNISYPYAIVDSGKAIFDTITFISGFCFNRADPGTYYITIKHRNSLEIWSKQGGEFFGKSTPTYYDFTSNDNSVYGNNLTLIGTKYCLYSGDVNQDGYITLYDVISIYNDAANFITGNFLKTDLTGDKIVDLTDVTIGYNNSANFVSIRRP